MKTLAIRLEDTEHELLVLIARVEGTTLAEELRQAVIGHISAKRSAPDFSERAQAILAEIDQEAAARRTAIQALFEEKGASAEPSQTESGQGKATKSRRR